MFFEMPEFDLMPCRSSVLGTDINVLSPSVQKQHQEEDRLKQLSAIRVKELEEYKISRKRIWRRLLITSILIGVICFIFFITATCVNFGIILLWPSFILFFLSSIMIDKIDKMQ